jgi:hypothetical protein
MHDDVSRLSQAGHLFQIPMLGSVPDAENDNSFTLLNNPKSTFFKVI